MRATVPMVMAVVGALLGAQGAVRQANAILTACTAAQISSQDGNCPTGTGPCSITKVFSIPTGCSLDFGTRNVTITASGKLDIGAGSVTLLAGSVTLNGGALIEGLGNMPSPGDHGGMITIRTTGAVSLLHTAMTFGVINVNGDIQGGTVFIDAGGSVTVAGKIIADNSSTNGSGGTITIRSGGDVVTQLNSLVSANGSTLASGGLFDVVAAGRVDFGDIIDLVGGDGGLLDVTAGTDAVVRRVDAFGSGDAGSGGCVGVVAGTQLQVLGQVNINGNSSGTGSGGGCGGFVCFESRFGDTIIPANVFAEGADPDGGGGGVAVISRGSVVVSSTSILSARGNGSQGCGGEVSLAAGIDVQSAGVLDASGGFGGNLVDIEAGRDITLTGRVDASARSVGGFGGVSTMTAGSNGKGVLSIGNIVDVGGGGCDPMFGCGVGGFSDLRGCDLTLLAAGSVLARGSDAGMNMLLAREQLTVQGAVTATSLTLPLQGSDGSNAFSFPSRKPALVTGAVVPTPALNALGTCTGPGQPACIDPCPTCGNGVVEFPETCDTIGAPQSCDGCSAFCRVESCNDGSVCTADTCDPLLGCRHAPVPDGTSCSDSNVCDGIEQCSGGFCAAGTPLNCNDSNPCTLDPCDSLLGCLAHPPAPAGIACSDNNQCTLGDVCDGAGGCSPGATPRVCDDGNECTTDSCNPASGCVFTPRTGACTDEGNECTTDVCSGGTCTHPARTGTCTDDGNECTTDVCSAGTCTHPARTGTCTDEGNECTTDVCSGGACTHPARTGTCTDDGNACTSDACSGGACTHPARANGTACNDGLFCTINDGCQGGVCTGGAPRNCGDGNSCTADTCDELSDSCVSTPIVPCCGNGVTEPGEECDDANASNTDGCLNTCRLPTCGDGFLRTGVEQCDQGAGNSNAPNAACRGDCTLQRCGDSVLDDLRGEQCDDGNATPNDGCSPRCFLDPPLTGDRIPGRGSVSTDCALEWAMDQPTLDINGIPSVKQSCRDGDVRCDHGTTVGECTFQVWSCVNNNDPRLPFCAPGAGAGGIGTVFRVDTLKPSIRDTSTHSEDGGNRLQILRAASADQSVGNDVCGPRMDIRVPLKPTGKKGVKTLRVKGTTNRDVRDADVLKLFCLP